MGYGYNPIVGENWRYNPDKTFKISRSKIELYFNCPTCFYKDAKLGLRKPPYQHRFSLLFHHIMIQPL